MHTLNQCIHPPLKLFFFSLWRGFVGLIYYGNLKASVADLSHLLDKHKYIFMVLSDMTTQDKCSDI